jgi:iron(III) transport system substrate-binding protein
MVFTSSPRRRVAALAVAAAAASLIAVGAASSRPAKKPGPLAGLIAQSKKEDGVVVYGNPPAKNFAALVQRFNFYYPWIKVTEYDLEDADIFSKYASESAQGVRTADILIASAPHLWVYAARQGYADRSFTPLGLARFPAWVKQYKGIYIMSPDAVIILYNKLLLKGKVPSSLTEIANDPATYSKVTGYSADNTFGYTGLYGYVQLKGWSNLEKVGKRWVPSGNVAAHIQLVSQGGAQVAYLTSPTAKLRLATEPALGNILGWSYVTDGQPIVPRGIAVTAKAHSPASAKLFLDFIYSKAGQQAMCDASFTAFMTGFTPANGCTNTLADVYAKVGQKNVFNPGFTQKFVNARPAFVKRWHGIFG